MDYVSDEQRKAVMASLNDRGLLYSGLNENYFSKHYSLIAYLDTRNEKRRQNEQSKIKRIKKRKVEEEKEFQEGLSKIEMIKKCKVEDELKQIINIDIQELYKNRKSLSCKFNDVIRSAVQAGMDKNIIVKLRELQQQLIKDIPNTIIIISTLRELQQQINCKNHNSS